MDEKDSNVAQTTDDELNTTAPQSEREVWKMPEPVFRRTSGKLPRGFAKTVDAGDPELLPEEREYPTIDTQNDGVTAYSEPKPKNPALKIILVLLGLGAMIAFIVVFLTVLYFFFWRSGPST